MLNAPGTIDQDCRGEIKIILRKSWNKDYEIKNSDCIAHLVVVPVSRAFFLKVENFTETERGFGLFGSSGV